METKKVLSLIFSLLFVGVFAFVLVWGITNFNKVQAGISGAGIYTQEDLEKAYEDGYNTALTDKTKYQELINTYRDTITDLTNQVTSLTYTNLDCENKIKSLSETKLSLLSQIDNLTISNNQNEEMIDYLNVEKSNLEKQVKELMQSNEDKDEEIFEMNNQIANLQALISQLQATNALNVETIKNLNIQIANLNAQISDLTMQLQSNSSNVAILQVRIAELEQSIAYYEQYIANLENGEQVVATFEFAGSVYNIQILAKNSVATAIIPNSTEYVIFNYWTVEGIQVDLSNYKVQTNTRFIANVTYKYDVKFMVNSEVYDSQIVVKNGYPITPTAPVLNGYDFEGWTTNGVDIVKPNMTAITMNTTYYAKLTQLHTVTFMYEDSIISTQQVRNEGYVNPVSVEDTEYKAFNGWLVNGIKVDLSTYKITGSEIFVADIIYRYDVVFMVDDAVCNSQFISKDNKVSIPQNPTKQGYEFDGWTLNGEDIVNLANYLVTSNTTFTAKFTKLHNVSFIYNDNVMSNQAVRNGGNASNVSISDEAIIFNGWMLNGTIVNIEEISITEDTIFVANVSYMEATFTYETWNNLVNKNITQSVVFDRYSSENQYMVNGVNVIDGISSKPLNTDNTIQLYESGGNVYVLSNYTIKINTCENMFSHFKLMTNVKFANFNTSNIVSMKFMFWHCEALESIDVSMLDTSNVTSMWCMFADCKKITTLDLSTFNTANVDDMYRMFDGCESLNSINFNNWNTSKVSTMSGMFYECLSLTSLNLSSWDTSSVTNFSLMFYGCASLSDLNISSFNTSNATNISSMFKECNSLTSIELINFDTSNTTEMNYLFSGCDKLVVVDCSSFNTSKITDFRGMFDSCPLLKTIYVSEGFVTEQCTNDYSLFSGSVSLVGAIAYDNAKQGIAYANYTTGYFTYKARA